jgi:RNA polymerase sigma-70 factor (ECF subfamily)
LTTTPDVPIDTLMSHAAGLRALARGLLGDDDAAEDVLQETWVAALEGSPSSGAPLGGWLRSVVRHLALKRRRTEARRSSRERATSREEALTATDDAVAQRETLQRVVDAVLDLDEVYSQAVLMRYFQDLPPRAIAAHLCVPVATVDSRLHRARAKLRERLDAADGGERTRWASALAAATGWRGSELATAGSAGSNGALGGMAMEWKILLIGAGTLALTLGGARWWRTTPAGSSYPIVAADTESSDAGTESTELRSVQDAPEQPAQAASERTPVEAPVATASLPLAPRQAAGAFGYVLRGRVVDTDDLPVASADVFFAPPGHPIRAVRTSDADGRFTLAWQAEAASMEGLLWVDAQFRGFAPVAARHVELAAGTTDVRAVLVPGDSGSVSFGSYSVRETALEANVPIDAAEADATEDTGALLFDWPTPGDDEVIEIVDVSFGELDASTRAELERLGYVTEGAILGRGEKRASPPPSTVRIAGTVLRADGTAAGRVPLVLRSVPSGALRQVLRADDDGVYAVRVPAGGYQLVAGGGSFGLASASFALGEEDLDGGRDWSPVLDRGLEVRGTVTLASGAPADGWAVVFEQRGEVLSCDATVTRDGAFALPNVAGSGRLHLIAPGGELAAYVVENVTPASETLEVVVPETTGTLVVSIHAPDAPDMHSAEVWVRQVSTGRTSWLPWSEEHEAHGQALPTGTYHVVAGGAEHGYVDLGEVRLVEGGEVALQAVLPARGGVSWNTEAAAESELSWTLYRRGPAVSSRMTSGALSEPPAFPLPAGEYELFVHGDDVSAAAQRFTVAPGGTPELELDPSALHELGVRVTAAAEREGATTVRIEDAESGRVVYTQPLRGEGVRIHLRTGRYVVTARAADGEEVTGEVAVPESGAIELSLE